MGIGGPDQPGVARSPAVGYFLPAPNAEVGRAVRSGDLLGHVEMLGIHHDVPAPADGIVIRSLAASGEAVEYGQPLVIVESGASILDGSSRQLEERRVADGTDVGGTSAALDIGAD